MGVVAGYSEGSSSSQSSAVEICNHLPPSNEMADGGKWEALALESERKP